MHCTRKQKYLPKSMNHHLILGQDIDQNGLGLNRGQYEVGRTESARIESKPIFENGWVFQYG